MTASTAPVIQPMRIADARASLRHVFIRDLVLDCSIGVHDHEHLSAQPVRINLDLAVMENQEPVHDRLENVVCYEKIADGVRAIVADGHVNLVETLAERIAAMCLQDGRVEAARVRVEKLAVFDDAASVGIEIERFAAAR